MFNDLEKYFDELEKEGFDFTIKDDDRKYMDGDYNNKYTKKYHGMSPPPELDDEYKYQGESDISTPIFTDESISDSDSESDAEEDITESNSKPPPKESITDSIILEDNHTITTTPITNNERIFNPIDTDTRDLEYDRMLATDVEMQHAYIEKLLQTSLACAGKCIKDILTQYVQDSTIPSIDLELLPNEIEGHLELGIRDDKNKILYIYGFGLEVVKSDYKLDVPPRLVLAHDQVTQNIIPSLFKKVMFLYDYVKKTSDTDIKHMIMCPLQNGNDCPLIILIDQDINKCSDTPWNDVSIGIGIKIVETVKTFDELEQQAQE